MKQMYRRFLALWLIVCLLATYATPLSAWAATPAAPTRSAFDPDAGGLDLDRHTEEDNITYTDDHYRFTKKLAAVPHTYQAWVKVPASVTGAVGNIMGNRRANGNGIFLQFGIEENNAPSLIWRGKDNIDHNVTFTSTDPVFPYDTWTQITIVHDEVAGAVRLYVNGALYATNTTDYAPIQQSSAMYKEMMLGSDSQHWDTRTFLGALGDVAIYQDALSAQEILESYEKGIDPSAESLMAFYDISADSKHTNIADSSSNGYDLEYSKMWLTEEEMNEIRKANGMLDENGEYTYDYSFAVVGDTQYVTRFYPKNLPIIYQWIVDNKDAKKMQYVVGMGDITDQDNDAQWAAAKNAISIMDGKIDYSLIRGNHDVLNGGDLFDTYFATDAHYTNQFELYGGMFPAGSVANTYRTLRVGSTDWLFINLDWVPSDAVIDWAIDVVEKHPDHKVIISTHGYLGHGGEAIDTTSTGVDAASRNSGDQIWTKLASQYENVEMVLCGHVSADDIIVAQNKGVHGNTVTQILIDPQRVDYWWDGTITYLSGGAGIVTMLYFTQDGSKVYVENYSTIRGMYYQTYNQMTVDLDAPGEEVTEYWDSTVAVKPDGAGTKEDPYLISNAMHLYWISQEVMNATNGIAWGGYCLQVNDIDLRGFDFPSIGCYYKGSNNTYRVFSGVYDGNGYTIKNGSIVSSSSSSSTTDYHASGLFGMISGATIRNLTLDNITSTAARGSVGILVGAANPALTGTAKNSAAFNLIENCTITSTCKAVTTLNGHSTNLQKSENSDYTPRVGGIAGALAYTTVRNCVNEATVYSPGNHAQAGGIAGALFNDCVIDSCVNRGDVVLDFGAAYNRFDEVSHIQGGIVGSINGTSTIIESSTNNATDGSANDFKQGNIVISNCENQGDFLLKGTAPKGKAIIWGGIVGYAAQLRPDTSVILHDVVNTGEATVESTQTIPTHFAGIVGYATAQTDASLSLSRSDNRTEIPAYNEGTQSAVNTAHSFASEWTADQADTHSADCACGCNGQITLAHRWDSGTVTVAATHTTQGTMTYTCADCGATKTASIEKDPSHSFGSWTADGADTHSAVCACGETRTYAHVWNNWTCVYCDEATEDMTTYWDGITATKPDGSGTEEDPYLISNAAHLYWISQTIHSAGNMDFDGYCLQVNDIDLGGYTLTSIGEYYQGSNNIYRVFSGVYDGNGYTIKNGSIVSSAEATTTSKTNFYASGLFGMISGATIRDLTLDNITSSSLRGVVGVLVGAANPALTGTADNSPAYNLIENCVITSTCKAISKVNGHSTYMKQGGDNSDFTPRVGGIAGALAYTTVRNCVNEATVYSPGNHANAGGIAGALYDDCVIDSSINRGDIVLDFSTGTTYNRYDTMSHIQGGIVGNISGAGKVVTTSTNNATDGSANYYKQGNIRITDCENHGNFQLKGTAPKGKAIIWGGIVGLSEKLQANKTVTLRDVTNTGTATVEKTQTVTTYIGGIVGYATHDATATAQTNSSLGLFGYDNQTSLAAYNQAAVNDDALPPVTTSEAAEDEETDGTYGVLNIPDATLAKEVSDKQQKAKDVRDAYPALKAAIAAGEKFVCPMCDAGEVAWTKLTKGTGNKTDGKKYHYYIDSTFTSHSGTNLAQVSSGKTTMCIALIDANLSTTGRIHVSGSSIWNFMGEGTITTNSASSDAKDSGLFTVNGSGTPTLNLYGGTYLNTSYGNTAAGRTYGANSKLGIGTIYAYKSGSTINMFDGVVLGPETADPSYELVNAVVVGTFNMYGGTMRNSVANGANAGVIVSGTFNMYGGTITGGQGKTGSTDHLGNISNSGTFKMYGGTISNGIAKHSASKDEVCSGNLHATGSNETYLYGGTITGGQSDGSGGNIGIYSGSLYIGGKALIKDGSATRGGNIAVADDDEAKNIAADITIDGGKITKGTATSGKNADGTTVVDGCGGNIYIGAPDTAQTGYSRKLEISGDALITGGTAPCGGNIYLSANSAATVSGGTISAGVAATGTASGGNVYLDAATLEVSGGKLDGKNGQATLGGNIFNAAGTVTVSDTGEITKGYATSDGGNIYCYDGATVNVDGGKITYGTAVRGGNISTRNAATYDVSINMTSGEISYGTATGTGSNDGGGNIFAFSGNSKSTTMDKATINITGGTVKDGQGYIGGNIFMRNSAVLLLGKNGTISGGKSTSKADNVYVWNESAAVISGTVTAAADAAKYNIHVATSANLWLKDSATVNGLGTTTTAKCIYSANSTGYLVVDPGWTGSANVILNSWTEEDGAQVPSSYCLVGALTVNYDKANTRQQDTTATYTGKLKLVNSDKVVVGTLTGVNGTLVYNALSPEFKPAENDGNAYCEACDKFVLWTPYADLAKGASHAAGGHYYLAGNVTYSDEGFQVTGNACFHTNGYTMSPDSTGTLGLFATGTLNIMGDGTVIGGSSGAIYLNGGKASSKTNVYGGTFKSNRSDAPVVWIRSNGGTVNFYDGTIDAAGANNAMCLDGSKGGTYSGPATFNMNGGKIINGNSWLRTEYASFNMNGGLVDGYIGTGEGGDNTDSLDNITAGTGYTKYIVDGKAVITDATQAKLFAVIDDDHCYGLFTSFEAAQAALAEGRTSVVLQDITDAIELTGDVTIDLGGKTLTVDLAGYKLTATGTGTLRGIDTANDSYDAFACGKITLQDGASIDVDNTVNGVRYIAVKNADKTYSYHRLDVAVKHVTIRTTETGLYYKSAFKADEVLLSAATKYGVVLSLNNMPGADWDNDGTDVNIATEVNAAVTPLESDKVVTSGSVFGIMKPSRDPETNARYGKMYIYANPYLVVDGNVIMCDTENVGQTAEADGFNGVAYSLFSALKKVNDNWNNAEVVKEENKPAFKAYYDKWAAIGMNLWADELPNISSYAAQ